MLARRRELVDSATRMIVAEKLHDGNTSVYPPLNGIMPQLKIRCWCGHRAGER